MIDLKTIIEAVNVRYQTDVSKRTRNRYVCEARHMACLLAVMARHSYSEVAKGIKRKHAKTVASDARGALDLIDTCADFRSDFVALCDRVGIKLDPSITYKVGKGLVWFSSNGTRL